MAFFNRTEIGLKDTGYAATVPNDPKAKLMYYLNCICAVLKLDGNPNVNRLRQYGNYKSLTHNDTDILLDLCLLLKPDILVNKCIFQDDNLCGDSWNKFYDLETVRHDMLVAGNILIGGQNKQVTRIMTFKMYWLTYNWTNPMQILVQRQRQEKEAEQERRRQERRRQESLRQELEAEQERRRQESLRQERRRQERQRQEKEAEQERRRQERRRQERRRQERRRQESLRQEKEAEQERRRQESLRQEGRRQERLRQELKAEHWSQQSSKLCAIL